MEVTRPAKSHVTLWTRLRDPPFAVRSLPTADVDEAVTGSGLAHTAATANRPILWMVHSGYNRGDRAMVQSRGFDVLNEASRWDYGDVNTKDKRVTRLGIDTPDILLISVAKTRKQAQPRVSSAAMLETVRDLVYQQLQAGRHADVYGFQFEADILGDNISTSR